MIAIVDIGSNTVRFSSYEVNNGNFRCVIHKKEMAGLAGYVLEDGSMSYEGIRKAIDTLNSFKSIIEAIKPESIHFFATAAIRNTVNTDEVVSKIKEETGFDVEVISGEEEAVCDFEGAICCGSEKNGMLVDIGGGSTELVFFKDGKIDNALSMHIGSLNIYKQHVEKIIPKREEIKEIKKHVKSEIKKTGITKAADNFTYGVGGTIRAACKIYNEVFSKEEDNVILETSKLKEMLNLYKNDKQKMAERILLAAPERIHTFIPGLTIFCTILEEYSIRYVRVSKFGVREGYLIRHVINK